MTLFLIIIHVAVCLLLILVILLQAGRGQGLSGPSFGSGNVQSLFGTRASDFLTKATSVAAICFLFTSIGLNWFDSRKSKSLMEMTQKNAPLDMDAVKKALEKVKASETTTPETGLPQDAIAKGTEAAQQAADEKLSDEGPAAAKPED
ncbi:MAG: preprotein translocase subunit SecG [Omnitrophica bacterium GWA2_52_8]|nr:MAG: preprotein translocase subunit SecG [Omnitrophica bacterium GWA2_52_8]